MSEHLCDRVRLGQRCKYEDDHPGACSFVKCLVYDESCAEHGFIHGAEASELREGIEALLDQCGEMSHDDWTEALTSLLDRVDARDSLARLEAQVPPGVRRSGRSNPQAEVCARVTTNRTRGQER